MEMDGSSGPIDDRPHPDHEEELMLTVRPCLAVVLAVIPDPANVTVVSYNLGVVLEWDYPHEWHENVTFTASSSSYKANKIVCANQTERRCDFTKDVHHFGTYVFKVRAELQGEASRWVNTSDFSADKHTIIGPPGITLYSKDGDMEVELQDPVMRASTLREVYSMVTYNITFWKEGQEEEKIKKNTEQTRLMLPNLQPWTNYCVQAQVYINAYTRNGELSKVVCKATTSNGNVEPGVVAVVLVVSFLVTSTCILLTFFTGRVVYRGLRFFYPNAKLPEHFKQYLIEPPPSSFFVKSIPQVKEQFDPIVIVSEDAVERTDATEEPRETEEQN
ncbi:Interleukin-10 receptor beta chain precursor-like, partial [Scleropages formosus]